MHNSTILAGLKYCNIKTMAALHITKGDSRGRARQGSIDLGGTAMSYLCSPGRRAATWKHEAASAYPMPTLEGDSTRGAIDFGAKWRRTGFRLEGTTAANKHN